MCCLFLTAVKYQTGKSRSNVSSWLTVLTVVRLTKRSSCGLVKLTTETSQDTLTPKPRISLGKKKKKRRKLIKHFHMSLTQTQIYFSTHSLKSFKCNTFLLVRWRPAATKYSSCGENSSSIPDRLQHNNGLHSFSSN